MTVGKDSWGGLAPSQERKDLPPPPHWRLEAVAAVERPHHLQVSPDGSRLAFMVDRGDLGSDVWMMDVGDGAPRQLTVDRPPLAFWEDTPPAWSPDGRHLAYVSDGWVRLIPADGGPGHRLAVAGSPRWLDDHTLVVSYEVDRETTATQLPTVTEVSRLALVDMGDPWLRPVTEPGADASDPDPHGKRLAFTSHPPDDRNRSDIIVVDVDSGKRTVVAATPGTHAALPRWSRDGTRLVYVSEEPGWYQLHVWAGEGPGRRLTTGEGDFGAVRWSMDDTSLLTTRTARGRSDLVVVEAEEGIVRTLAGGGTWQDPGWLADGSVVAIYEDHATPARIEKVAPDGTRSVVWDQAPSPVRAAPHVAPSEVVFPGADGLQIPAFLLQPARTDGPAPAVVYPHGGPTSHYGDEWDGYAQYFLDKGYAWLAVNFRGSTSYGRDFERANHGVWGVDDTRDCLAAADYLAGLGWVDPDRIAIFGASYGSYMALASLTDDPDHRFACGVAKYGDCDILTSWAQGDRVGVEDLERMMSHPAHARAAYRAGSPIHRLERMQRPILVAHGEKDQRVDPRQSEELVKELERLGKTFEYVTYPTEGHGFLRRDPQLHFYRRLERFLDWYLM